MENLQKLTDLQKSLGYLPGEVHPVAILGLMGECGEVCQECSFLPSAELKGEAFDKADERTFGFIQGLSLFITCAEDLDTIKKQLRSEEHHGVVVVTNDHENAFNIELADVFYYLNAVAIARGLSIDDLARLAYEKVMRKRQTIGPELLGK